MGDNRLALEWLQKSAADGFPCYPFFDTDPNLARLRSEPAFVAFMANLKTEWQRYRDL